MRVFRESEVDLVYGQLRQRTQRLNGGESFKTVEAMFRAIQTQGDRALFAYCKRFDKFCVDETNLAVTREEIDHAYAVTDKELIKSLQLAAKNIYDYHAAQKRESIKYHDRAGVELGLIIRPVERGGIYVPGGKASYPSSVLMNALPAKVAGVSDIIMATPPDEQGKINPLTLVAADIAGVSTIYKMGGAQAVIAMALGTKSVRRADKIVGPGNLYVNIAKRLSYGYVGLDMLAGPSEVLIIADEGADVRFIAADFLSQAEHDEYAACVLLTHSQELAEEAQGEIQRQLANLPKYGIAKASIDNYGAIVITSCVDESIRISNEIAPEHLEIMTVNPKSHLSKIKNAGSVFLGSYSPEPVGDYFAGVNHVLPTNGTARFASPLSVDDFLKKMSYVHYTKDALLCDAGHIERLAEAEGLIAHKRSVSIRFEEDNGSI